MGTSINLPPPPPPANLPPVPTFSTAPVATGTPEGDAVAADNRTRRLRGLDDSSQLAALAVAPSGVSGKQSSLVASILGNYSQV